MFKFSLLLKARDLDGGKSLTDSMKKFYGARDKLAGRTEG